jgi:hypothetical protein
MSSDPRKRQKKLESRAAKRKAKQHQLTKQKHAGLPERLAGAARFPVLDSCATEAFWDQGLGWVCLSRELPSNQVAYAVFLVDRYCLGVKDIAAAVTNRSTYESQVVRKMRRGFSARDLTPAAVRKLVEEAVEYARSLGLHPHPDYQQARRIFGTIDPHEATDAFEFGKDGKPLFVSGPNDTPERCRHILKTLLQSCGPDGFHYLIRSMDPGEVLPDELLQRDPRLLGPDDAGAIRDFRLGFEEGPREPEAPG